MHHLTLSLAALLTSVSCTLGPTLVTRPGGTQLTTLGGSLLSRAGYETATLTHPDGTMLTVTRHDRDDTRVPVVTSQLGLAGSLGTQALRTTGTLLAR
jgi:hypothetical protein